MSRALMSQKSPFKSGMCSILKDTQLTLNKPSPPCKSNTRKSPRPKKGTRSACRFLIRSVSTTRCLKLFKQRSPHEIQSEGLRLGRRRSLGCVSVSYDPHQSLHASCGIFSAFRWLGGELSCNDGILLPRLFGHTPRIDNGNCLRVCRWVSDRAPFCLGL